MRKIPSICIFIVLILIILATPGLTCTPDLETTPPVDENLYKPVFITRDSLENSIKLNSNRQLLKTGKIYYKAPILFVVETFEGIHVFDNTDPKAPRRLGFITILGCVDLAVKGNLLYADNSVDLVVLNIPDIKNIKVVNRIRAVFPEPYPPNLNHIPSQYSRGDREPNQIIVKWEKR